MPKEDLRCVSHRFSELPDHGTNGREHHLPRSLCTARSRSSGAVPPGGSGRVRSNEFPRPPAARHRARGGRGTGTPRSDPLAARGSTCRRHRRNACAAVRLRTARRAPPMDRRIAWARSDRSRRARGSECTPPPCQPSCVTLNDHASSGRAFWSAAAMPRQPLLAEVRLCPTCVLTSPIMNDNITYLESPRDRHGHAQVSARGQRNERTSL